jgi:hypothetical protein
MLLALGLSISLDELAIGFTIGLLHLSITAAADTTTSAVRRMPKAPNVIANPPRRPGLADCRAGRSVGAMRALVGNSSGEIT